MAGIDVPLQQARARSARRYQQSVPPAAQVWDLYPAAM
jgi:hypothetical protein